MQQEQLSSDAWKLELQLELQLELLRLRQPRQLQETSFSSFPWLPFCEVVLLLTSLQLAALRGAGLTWMRALQLACGTP